MSPRIRFQGNEYPRTYTALGVVHYDDKRGMAGNLKGVITFTDGTSLKVWDDDLHAVGKALGQERTTEVRYQLRHSEKWGDSLTMIERAVPHDHELYDEQRVRDEQRGRVQPNSFLGHQIAKGVGVRR